MSGSPIPSDPGAGGAQHCCPENSAEMAEQGGHFRRVGREHPSLLVTFFLTQTTYLIRKGGKVYSGFRLTA